MTTPTDPDIQQAKKILLKWHGDGVNLQVMNLIDPIASALASQRERYEGEIANWEKLGTWMAHIKQTIQEFLDSKASLKELKLCLSSWPMVARRDKELNSLRHENTEMREALEKIRDEDWIENTLNPQKPRNIALVVLEKYPKSKSESRESPDGK